MQSAPGPVLFITGTQGPQGEHILHTRTNMRSHGNVHNDVQFQWTEFTSVSSAGQNLKLNAKRAKRSARGLRTVSNSFASAFTAPFATVMAGTFKKTIVVDLSLPTNTYFTSPRTSSRSPSAWLSVFGKLFAQCKGDNTILQ